MRSTAGATARELALYTDIARQRRGSPALLVLPSQGREDGASNLRGCLIADQLRARRWRTLICPKHLRLNQRRRMVNAFRPDVILMQAARHPLNRPKHYPGIPIVFDLDDADYLAAHSAGAVVEALRGSTAVIAGSASVAAFCRKYNERVSIVWTGSPVSPGPLRPQTARDSILTWAASGPVQSVAEAAFVTDILTELVRRNTCFKFRLYSDDGSEAYRRLADRFRATGATVETQPYLPYPDFLASLEDVSVGLAPLVDIAGFSGGKSFGKILAYLDRGVPIITHPVVDHPLFFKDGVNGIMTNGAESWADHIIRLLADPDERSRLAQQGRLDFEQRLSTQVAADQVEMVLRSALHTR